VRLTLRNDMGEVMELDLVRGTPEFLDSMGNGVPMRSSMGGSLSNSMGGGMPGGGMHIPQGMGMGGSMGGSMGGGMPVGGMGMGMGMGGMPSSLYASGNRMPSLNKYMLGTSWSAEMMASMPPPQAAPVNYSPERALQEENEWLRSALRMAESTIMHNRQDLGGMRESFLSHKHESETRITGMENNNKSKDDERRESEQQLLHAEELRRTLEVKLAEAQRRSEWQRDTERQIHENERARLDYLNEIKRRAEEEKRVLEMEMLRLQDDLRSERASRVEAEVCACVYLRVYVCVCVCVCECVCVCVMEMLRLQHDVCSDRASRMKAEVLARVHACVCV